MRLKIKPSAKIHRRYILMDAKRDEVEKTILEYIGVLGWAEACPVFIHPFKNLKKGNIILAVERKALTKVRASFEMSTKRIRVLNVSGTLKNLMKI